MVYLFILIENIFVEFRSFWLLKYNVRDGINLFSYVIYVPPEWGMAGIP